MKWPIDWLDQELILFYDQLLDLDREQKKIKGGRTQNTIVSRGGC